jgi:uncharacterized protein DUF29
MKWQELSVTSHYQTAIAVEEALDRGDVADAKVGLEELIDALSRADKRALNSHMIRLMMHVIKWKTQPECRSRRWRATIRNARREIAKLQKDTPSLTRKVIEEMWKDSFDSAKEEAEGEMNKDVTLRTLSWKEVFEKDYDTNGNNG